MATATRKKRVLFFIAEFPVLSETFIEREVCELQKRGNLDVKVVSLSKSSDLTCDALEDKVSYIKLALSDITKGYLYFITHNPVGIWRTRAISLKNKNRGFFANWYLWAKSVGFAYLFKNFNAGQLHAHFFSEPSTIALYASILLELPFSLSGHARDVFAKTGQAGQNPELIEDKLKYAQFAVLCNAKAYAHCVNTALVKDKKKVYLAYHGVDLTLADKFPPASVGGVPAIYFLGRFVEKKGAKYLLEAAKHLVRAGEKFKLVIAGYGPQSDELKKLAQDYGLADIAYFVNDGEGVDPDTALKLMHDCSVFVMPAIDLESGDSDGIPNNLLEAGIFSKPVVTTNAGSIGEIVKDGLNGLVVDQKDSRALAAAITKLLHDKNLAERLGASLHVHVREQFDIKKNIIELEKLLLEKK